MVIPIHDRNPVRRTPVVTYGLIAINLAVFLLEPVHHVQLGPHGLSTPTLCEQYRFFDHYAAIPHELMTGHIQGHQSVNAAGQAMCSDDYAHKNAPLSVLYSMFLHASWLHVLGNMLFLYVFGNNVEDRMGRVRYVLFYLAAGYVSAYGFALIFPNSQTVLIGASGAIAGILGAYLVLWPRARVWSLVPFLLFIPLRLPAWLVLGSWFVLQWWYAATGQSAQGAGVAYVAHVVGFLFGMVIAMPFRGRGPSAFAGSPRGRRRWLASAQGLARRSARTPSPSLGRRPHTSFRVRSTRRGTGGN
jgi:membrane associated rhomboid family serine protease